MEGELPKMGGLGQFADLRGGRGVGDDKGGGLREGLIPQCTLRSIFLWQQGFSCNPPLQVISFQQHFLLIQIKTEKIAVLKIAVLFFFHFSLFLLNRLLIKQNTIKKQASWCPFPPELWWGFLVLNKNS